MPTCSGPRRMPFTVLAFFAAAVAFAAEPPPRADFSVLHITDIHIDPQHAGEPPPARVRGSDTLDWIVEQTRQPQRDAASGLDAPPPALALVTGDITEYGVIDDTWSVVEQQLDRLACKWYALAGNHDNTWGAMYHILRARHGSENYVIDQGGVRLVNISSASPQEPVPTIDGRTRAFLASALEQAGPRMPVVLALHHPIYSDELANPVEKETLIDLLRDYNVVAVLYGHGHGVNSRDIDGLRGAMGGSTFGKNAGYGLLTFRGDTVRYDYCFHRGDPAEKPDAPESAKAPAADPNDPPAPKWKKLFERPIPDAAAPRLFEIAAPRAGEADAAGKLLVRLAPKAAGEQWSGSERTCRIDGAEVTPPGVVGDPDVATLDTSALTPGLHLLSVSVKTADGRSDRRTRVFEVTRDGFEVAWRRALPAAVKAGPVVAGDTVYLARTDGRLDALDLRTGQERWSFSTSGEILGAPARADDTIVFGSGDGHVYALDRDGEQRWSFYAGAPMYGGPLVAAGVVYVGDNAGRLHALRLSSGERVWTFERARFAIESSPVLWDDLLVFGAWDGHLYAVDVADGKLHWKSLGPKASDGKGSRYYSPADCSPAVLGERLFVCDRGYVLGTYSRLGKLEQTWPAQAAAIVPAAALPTTRPAAAAASNDSSALLVRTTGDQVRRLNSDGETVWETSVPAGRFPAPPTIAGGRVYVCSNRGLLSVLDAADGRVIWQYQATAGYFVMAPVGVALDDASPARSVAIVAGMDGTVTAVRQK